MDVQRLVAMANQIADFFGSEPDRQEAIAGTASHLQRFWDPRMRGQIVGHLERSGGAGLNDVALAAVAQLAQHPAASAAKR